VPISTIIIPDDPLLRPCLDPVAEKLASLGHDVLRPTTLTPSTWQPLGQADAVVLTPRTRFTAAEIAVAAKLIGIVFPTIGVEALDLAAATAAGVAVGFGATPEAIESMAEANVLLIAALMLDLRGKTTALRELGWRDGTVRARMVRGKLIGFVGFGRIARATLARLVAWGVRAQFYDPYVTQWDAALGDVVKCEDLATLLRTSDVVNIQVNLTAETVGMIGEAELALMRSDAFLVNTARGGAVDEAALAGALAEQRIAGAALDAFAIEPLADTSPLRTLENVILTPHNIGHTVELQQSFVPATIENLLRLCAGEPPLYFRNPEVGDRWHARQAKLAALPHARS
jgi:D-3-phosphoglycerate dehydrogenase / 2-oxoglutarate reductase